MLLVTARTLSDRANAQFLVFWALFSFVAGTLTGMQTEATRAVSAAMLPEARRPAKPVRVVPASLAIGAGVAAIVLATSPLWAEHVFGGSIGAAVGQQPWLLVFLVAAAAVVYAGHVATGGVLSGRREWLPFSGLIMTEAIGRLAIVAVAGIGGLGLIGVEVGAAIPAALWILLVTAVPVYRRALSAVGDTTTRAYISRALQTMAAAAASAALITSFPFIVALVRPAGSHEELSAAFQMGLSLTRAPMLIPLAAYSTVIVTYFVNNRAKGVRALLRYLPAVLGLGVVAAALVAWAGPWVLRIFRPSYVLTPMTMALMTFAAVLIAILSVTGSAVLALDKHAWFLGGWLAALAVAVACLLGPWPIETRSLIALFAGPPIGIAIHLVAIQIEARALRRTAAQGRA